MPEFNMETPEQEHGFKHLTQLGSDLHLLKKSENGHMVRLRNLRLSTTEH